MISLEFPGVRNYLDGTLFGYTRLIKKINAVRGDAKNKNQKRMSQVDKSKYLRKLIDIPENILPELRDLAKEAGKTLKNYIEDVLLIEVEKGRIRKLAPQ